LRIGVGAQRAKSPTGIRGKRAQALCPAAKWLKSSSKRSSLRSSALYWCSEALTALAHITFPLTRVCCCGCMLAPRRREKGKPAARRGRKAYGPFFS
jgi:hypothetical protein